MDSGSFNKYKTRYRKAIRQVLASAEIGRLDEAAFPAYSHSNPYISYLFWLRLRKVIEYVERPVPYKNILDFGCGSGVMLPFLSKISERVHAIDIDMVPLSRIQEYLPLDQNVVVLKASKNFSAELPKNSFDLILALDVLEHVSDLNHVINELMSLLTPSGQLIISGPTENALYRLGRKLAGREFSGAYHERGISDIRRDISKFGQIIPIANIFWYLPLFEIFSIKRS